MKPTKKLKACGKIPASSVFIFHGGYVNYSKLLFNVSKIHLLLGL
jgi:hypothetical protein